MNSKEFQTIVEGCIANINGVLQSKSREYSSKDDKLHNFEQAKKIMRCNTKEYALCGMFSKHLVSIMDMVEKYEKYGILPNENMVEEKIGDSINYHILLKACFLSDIYDSKAKKATDKAFAEQQEAIRNSNGNEDIKFIKKLQEDMANSNTIKNPRKQKVIALMRKRLKPIREYMLATKGTDPFYQTEYFENLKEDHVSDDVFMDKIAAILQKLELPDNYSLPSYKFKTLKQIQKELIDDIEKKKPLNKDLVENK